MESKTRDYMAVRTETNQSILNSSQLNPQLKPQLTSILTNALQLNTSSTPMSLIHRIHDPFRQIQDPSPHESIKTNPKRPENTALSTAK